MFRVGRWEEGAVVDFSFFFDGEGVVILFFLGSSIYYGLDEGIGITFLMC